MNYWDTSTLTKLYVREADSPYFLRLSQSSQSPLITSDISRQEILCVLYRKEHNEDLKPGAAAKLFAKFSEDEEAGRILTIPNGKDVLAVSELIVQKVYKHSPPMMLRSLDTIHLASALVAKATTMVATDKRLRDVALLMNLNALPK